MKRISLNAIVAVVSVIGLAGVVWIMADVIRGAEPSSIALWMMLPVAGLGLLLNLALGGFLLWKKLRGGGSADKEKET